MSTCDHCGHAIEDDWSFCGTCGRPVVSPAAGEPGIRSAAGLGEPAPPAPAPAPGAGRADGAATAVLGKTVPGGPSQQAGQLDPARLQAAMIRMRRSDLTVAAGAFVLFVSLFLPWFGLGYLGSVSGISAHGWLFLVMLDCLAVLGYLAWTAARPRLAAAPAHWQGLLAATGFAALLTLLGLLVSPAGSSLQLGAVVAVGGAAAALGGAIATSLVMGREPAGDDDIRKLDLVVIGAELARRWRAHASLQTSSPAPVPQAPVPQAPVPQAPVPQAPVPQAPVSQAPVSQDQPAGAAVRRPAGNDAARPVGRGAIRVLAWGGTLALIGWAAWLVSVWKAAHAATSSLSCTIGQPAPIPGYGTCTPAVQKVLQQFSAASSQIAAGQWPDYHLDLAWAGLVLAITSLVLAYFYVDTPLLAPRKTWLAGTMLGLSVALAGTGALLVHTVRQLGSAISEAARVCNAVGANCISASSYIALLAGWIAVGAGCLAVLGGIWCAVSLAVRRRTMPRAGTRAPE